MKNGHIILGLIFSLSLGLTVHADPFERLNQPQESMNAEQPRKKIFVNRKERLEILAASATDGTAETVQETTESETVSKKKSSTPTIIKKIPGIDVNFNDGLGNSVVSGAGFVQVISNSSTSFSGSASAFSATVQ